MIRTGLYSSHSPGFCRASMVMSMESNFRPKASAVFAFSGTGAEKSAITMEMATRAAMVKKVGQMKSVWINGIKPLIS